MVRDGISGLASLFFAAERLFFIQIRIHLLNRHLEIIL
jgi:hypothetical protein